MNIKTAFILQKYVLLGMLLFTSKFALSQQKNADDKAIYTSINSYSRSVIGRDSASFYELFNNDPVSWCAALAPLSQFGELSKSGQQKPRSAYFSGSYKAFMRSLFRHRSTEDKFDNIQITSDGTAASVTMDYSFWADGRMTNWGRKLLMLIKREDRWKITSVAYSIELTGYRAQPSAKGRKNL